jgi:hypothetical protein
VGAPRAQKKPPSPGASLLTRPPIVHANRARNLSARIIRTVGRVLRTAAAVTASVKRSQRVESPLDAAPILAAPLASSRLPAAERAFELRFTRAAPPFSGGKRLPPRVIAAIGAVRLFAVEPDAVRGAFHDAPVGEDRYHALRSFRLPRGGDRRSVARLAGSRPPASSPLR